MFENKLCMNLLVRKTSITVYTQLNAANIELNEFTIYTRDKTHILYALKTIQMKITKSNQPEFLVSKSLFLETANFIVNGYFL